MQTYSDIISELIIKHNLESAEGTVPLKTKNFKGKFNLTREDFVVDDRLSKLLNKDEGSYSIINFPNLIYAGVEEKEYLINYLTKVLKKFLANVSSSDNVLVVGLGNRHISADSLGAKVVKNIVVTRHLKNEFFNLPKISAIATSVLGLTGIESSDVIHAVVNEIKPKKIIVIDTFCAANHERLGVSFQVNNAGITPGAGVNNARKRIDKKTMNLDVIVIGVPLVVYAQTILENVLSDNNKNLNLNINNNLQNLVLTIKDVEEIVNLNASIISYAINKALTGFSISEIKDILNKF